MTKSEIIEYLKDDVYSYCKDRLKRRKKVILPSALLIDAILLLENASDKNVEILISVNNPFMVMAGKKTLKNKIELEVDNKTISYKTFSSIKECVTAYLQSNPNLISSLNENTSCELGTEETEIYNSFNLNKLDDDLFESYYGEIKTSVEIDTSINTDDGSDNNTVAIPITEAELTIESESVKDEELKITTGIKKSSKASIVLGTKVLCTKAPVYTSPNGGVPKILGNGFYYITNPNPINGMYAVVKSKENVGVKGKLAGYIRRQHMAVCD